MYQFKTDVKSENWKWYKYEALFIPQKMGKTKLAFLFYYKIRQ